EWAQVERSLESTPEPTTDNLLQDEVETIQELPTKNNTITDQFSKMETDSLDTQDQINTEQ
ncbi:13858_t:CDS:1, partial [Dentiscutata heterogama]